jgi:hypothetical protein
VAALRNLRPREDHLRGKARLLEVTPRRMHMEDRRWWLLAATGSGAMGRKKEIRPPEEPTEGWIDGQLVILLGHGARARALREHTPGLVDLLCPDSGTSDSGLSDKERAKVRAREAEQIIRTAIEEMAGNYDGDVKEAILINFALVDGLGLLSNRPADDKTVQGKRRRLAAEKLGYRQDTYRKLRRKCLEDIAGILYRDYCQTAK